MKRFLLLITLPLLAQLSFATIMPGSDGEQSSSTTRGSENGQEWVDLGLPSGTLWATCNIRADAPEAYGFYFPWGVRGPRTKSIARILWSDYDLRTKGEHDDDVCFSKYNTDSKYGPVDNKTQLELYDDAAHAEWGGNWHIPTEEQWIELMENCTVEFYTERNNDGKITLNKATYTGPNGQSIVLPGNHYWSSTLCKENPIYAMDYYVMPHMKEHGIGKLIRNYTIAIRPVTLRPDISGNDNGHELEDMGLAENGSGSGDGLTSSTRGFENGHEWVDLDLPSGTKWATCNLGATDPAQTGDNFAWGEINPKTVGFNWENYHFRTSGSSEENVVLSKYNTDSNHGPVDNLVQLELSDDAAHVNWGGNWHIPTVEQWEELLNNCTSEIVFNGDALRLTGPNGQRIILFITNRKVPDRWKYWSNSICEDKPTKAQLFSSLTFFSQALSQVSNFYRYTFGSIRPVTQ